MLAGIVRLQLDRIGARIHDNHGAAFSYDDAAVEHIVSRCNDPASGGRMIDNIITNTLLPALSREILKRSIAREEVVAIFVTASDDEFRYMWDNDIRPRVVPAPVARPDEPPVEEESSVFA
jgi:type VI secretion system protein VasG